MKLVTAGSAEGLSYLSIFSELGAVTFTCTYNLGKGFPFRCVFNYTQLGKLIASEDWECPALNRASLNGSSVGPFYDFLKALDEAFQMMRILPVFDKIPWSFSEIMARFKFEN